MRQTLSGITVAKGLALGRARIREPQRLEIEDRRVAPDEVEAEIERLHQAIASTRQDLLQLRNQLHGELLRNWANSWISTRCCWTTRNSPASPA